MNRVYTELVSLAKESPNYWETLEKIYEQEDEVDSLDDLTLVAISVMPNRSKELDDKFEEYTKLIYMEF